MSTVKLEVGAWLIGNSVNGCSYQVTAKHPKEDWIAIEYNGQRTPREVHSDFHPSLYSGPYHIEPGDRVKPKPAGDKCWGEGLEVNLKYGTSDEFHVVRIGRHHKHGAWCEYGDMSLGVPLSCLILLEKGAKAPAQDFQVGDEVEFLGFKQGDPRLFKDITIGKKYVLTDGVFKTHLGFCGVGFNDDTGCPRTRHISEIKLIRRAGDWPSVNPGIELDKLPEDKETDNDRRGSALSGANLLTAERIMYDLTSLIDDLGITNNSDRERIRKIIPEIRKRLATLEGRL